MDGFLVEHAHPYRHGRHARRVHVLPVLLAAFLHPLGVQQGVRVVLLVPEAAPDIAGDVAGGPAQLSSPWLRDMLPSLMLFRMRE